MGWLELIRAKRKSYRCQTQTTHQELCLETRLNGLAQGVPSQGLPRAGVVLHSLRGLVLCVLVFPEEQY